MKLFTTKFKSGELDEKHVVATWNLGNHLSICFWAQGNQEKLVSRWQKNLCRDGLTCVEMYDIYHCCVYSKKLLIIDRGTVRDM